MSQYKPGGIMFKRRLGRSNLEVSAMGLGCWAIGGPWDWLEADGSKRPVGWGQVDDAESIRAIHYALDAESTSSTHANYGCGHSERILSQAIAGQRDKVVLATKFGYLVDEENASSETEDVIPRIRQECETSLQPKDRLYRSYHFIMIMPEGGEVCEVLETCGKERSAGMAGVPITLSARRVRTGSTLHSDPACAEHTIRCASNAGSL
jgi:hypothetical protein